MGGLSARERRDAARAAMLENDCDADDDRSAECWECDHCTQDVAWWMLKNETQHEWVFDEDAIVLCAHCADYEGIPVVASEEHFVLPLYGCVRHMEKSGAYDCVCHEYTRERADQCDNCENIVCPDVYRDSETTLGVEDATGDVQLGMQFTLSCAHCFERYCEEEGHDPNELVDGRLHDISYHFQREEVDYVVMPCAFCHCSECLEHDYERVVAQGG